ncbi:MAG TPA: hypothetical protein VKH19_11340 [Gemmatimonadaceae bacterium]|nr:hypothetical protein [Gemmatimonadaceae bacterium]
MTSPPSAAIVGDVVGPIVVRVNASDGSPVSGVPVTFAISRGGGSLSRTTDTTGSDGTADVKYTVGTLRATNEVEAVVQELTPLRFVITATEGPSAVIALGAREVRMPPGSDVASTSAVARDAFANPTNASITWTPRDSTLIVAALAPANNVRIQVLRRPGQTYLVGTAGAATDSILVIVQDPAAPCSMIDVPVVLAAGETKQLAGGTVCLHAADSSQYVLVTHYNTTVTTTATTFTALGTGLIPPDTAFRGSAVATAAPTTNIAFEHDLRRREASQITPWVPGARAWYDTRPAALRASVRVGDAVSVNVNAFDFCAAPRVRAARVAAVTNTAVVLADLLNPAGGFSDDEYRAFGEMMDTLVMPVDTAAFGAPLDMDGNGRTVILFTRAVNELTESGSPNGIVLGFYYQRDLLPQHSIDGDCPGSNMAEMFYVLVPDPNGTINANVRDKSFVQNVTPSTIAHELQHLINASRRMYVNRAPNVDEEPWLNEGLSHIAEELLFYRQSGLTPKANLDGGALVAGSAALTALNADQLNNFRRYREYLKNPEDFGPVSFDDQLETRGAAWSFLRYVADRTQASQLAFWRTLVNSRTTGVTNLDAALTAGGTGFGTLGLMRDWSVAVVADDIVPGIASAFQQPSWNFPSAMGAANIAFPLLPRILENVRPMTIAITGGGTSYMRFAVPPGADALLQVGGVNGRQLPVGLTVSVVRIK